MTTRKCNCFHCLFNRSRHGFDAIQKRFVFAVYYATLLASKNQEIKNLESLGYKASSISAEGVEGYLACIKSDAEFEACILDELLGRIPKKLHKYIHAIIKEDEL